MLSNVAYCLEREREFKSARRRHLDTRICRNLRSTQEISTGFKKQMFRICG